MTEKLYDLDEHVFAFEARLLECRQGKHGPEALLDRTAFFPEGGGQSADTGTIGPARVLDVHERGGEIWHLLSEEIKPGEYACTIDSEQRLRRMQNHSGEHVFSGITHRLYGAENVGFHMAADCMTIDFDRELSWDELCAVEYKANEAVRANIPVKVYYPGPEELAELEYRSKKELDGAVRIVEIKGIDRCACCAPHVRSTGEIGAIKLLTAERHRGGVRITLVCGMDALDDYRRKQNSAAAVSAMLSAKRDEIAPALERHLAAEEKRKESAALLAMRYAALRAGTAESTEGNICLFDDLPGEASARELVNLLTEKAGGVAALFLPGENGGYRYIIGSRRVDLRAAAREINEAIGGRGGGSSEMIRGSASGDAAQIECFFRERRF